MEHTGHDSGSCRWTGTTLAQWKKLAGSPEQAEEAGGGDVELEEIVGLEAEALELSGERVVFFRDPSGEVFPSDLWFPSKVFWSAVKTTTLARLRAA